MTNTELSTLVNKQWFHDFFGRSFINGEAKVVTGDCKIDSYLHYVEKECGVALTLDLDFHNTIRGYRIIDEQKFTWFVLKWS